MSARRFFVVASLLGLALGAIGGAALTLRILRPSTSAPVDAEAVLLFAGGEGERAAGAVEIATAQGIPTLIVSVGNGNWEGSEEFLALCDAEIDGLDVVCFSPEVDDTAGEAARMVEIAIERGYTSLIAATSDYHVSRAALRVRQCFDGQVGQFPIEIGATRNEFFHEFFGLIEALAIDRSCHD